MQSIGSFRSGNPIVNEIKDQLYEAAIRGQDIRLYWTRAHIGEWGNELADVHAKRASRKDQVDVTVKYFKSQIKEISKNQMIRKWQERWNNTKDGDQLYEIAPIVNIKKLSGNFYINQALTGHGAFPEYQNRFFNKDIHCGCGAVGTCDHVLLRCGEYEKERKEYFSTKVIKQLFKVNRQLKGVIEIMKKQLKLLMNSESP